MLKIVQIHSTETSPLNTQLFRLIEDNDEQLHLKVHKILDEVEWTQLGEFITNHKPFPFAKLSLHVDLNTLKNKQFL